MQVGEKGKWRAARRARPTRDSGYAGIRQEKRRLCGCSIGCSQRVAAFISDDQNGPARAGSRRAREL